MSRRGHRKSKNGCHECKMRLVKCNESRPSCINCQTAGFTCSFVNEHRIAAAHSSIHPATATASPASSGTKDKSKQDCTVYNLFSNASPVNMDHLRLFHHFQTETVNSFGSKMTDLESSYRMIMRCGMSTPYLMHEILAIAALHIGFLNPAEKDFYRHQATELQQSALAQFKDSNLEVTATNYIPMFLFSSFLGIHTLCDTLRYRDENLGTFLDHFTHYLNLHRGVRSITNTSWHLLLQSELAPWLKTSEVMDAEVEYHGNECSRLRTLVHATDITTSSIEVYEEAIKHLQLLFDSHGRIQRLEDSAQLVFAWPAIIPAEFSNLLSQGRAEALITLAHYAVLLHAHRWLWVIGDGGEFLIRSISRSLDPIWAKWLEWPLSVIETNIGKVF